jgi:hypothetical protein
MKSPFVLVVAGLATLVASNAAADPHKRRRSKGRR